jgi:hypothetical protein
MATDFIVETHFMKAMFTVVDSAVTRHRRVDSQAMASQAHILARSVASITVV